MMKPHSRAVLGRLALAGLLVGLGASRAPADAGADGADQQATQTDTVFDHLLVTGGAAKADRVPGSAEFIGREELRRHEHSDVHRILAAVPGVMVQEEEGYGLRPNIGMRGTGVERSQKITLLEDGVLIAPAPYSAPAAYYFPTTGRMESVEVRKGSASVEYGPYTNGGVINLVSSAIPSRLAARINAALGDDATRRLHANAGRAGDRLGWLVETYQLETDGFKELDGGGSTGVDLEDFLAKLRWNSSANARRHQVLELKAGATDQFGHETYLGLTEEDFAKNPLRRYAASADDFFVADHEQCQGRYFAQLGSSFHLTATAYRNDFFRNWHKLESVAGVKTASVLALPETYPTELAILRGGLDTADAPLAVRNNRRRYDSSGIDLVGQWNPRAETGRLEHQLTFGLRRHQDKEDRFQEDDLYGMSAGRPELRHEGSPGSQSNRLSSAEALAYYVRDELRWTDWTLSLGVRVEDIQFERLDFGSSDPSRLGGSLEIRESSIRVVLPGVGFTYRGGPRWGLFGGIHRGFAPPGPGQDAATRAEDSLNFEAGAQTRGFRALNARVVAFWSDYDNLLGRDTLSVGGEGSGDAFNGGEVEVRGLETVVEYDLGRARNWKAAVPLRLVYTLSRSEFQSSFSTSFADWAPAVERGDALPYLPEHQARLSAAAEGARWSGDVGLTYTSEMRTRAGQGPIDPAAAIGSRLLADVAVGYRLTPRLKAFAQVRNATDSSYLAARRPAGLRPGLPRTALLGFSWDY